MSSAFRAAGLSLRAQFNPISRLALAATLPAILFACGGGGGAGGGVPFAPIAVAPTPDVPPPPELPAAPPPTVAPPAASQTTTLVPSVVTLALSANNPGLNAALTGVMRTITITNTGLYETKGLTVTASPPLPPGSSFGTNCDSVVPAGSSCQVTVAPGLTPTAAPLTAPVPSTLRVAGENTTVSAVDIHILSYGSLYQAGYVFALDDTTTSTGSVGGKVLALSAEPGVQIWGPDGSISGAPYGDGRAATRVIVDMFPDQPSAAKTCASNARGGYSDWYLPGICEVNGLGCAAGSQTLMDTLGRLYPQSFDMSRTYWSADAKPMATPALTTDAISFRLYPGGGGFSNLLTVRSFLNAVQCMRDLSG